MNQFRDQMGNIIRLENYPKRIISIVPSQTELLYDLGLNEEVIGITKFCIHPNEWFRNKTRVGGTKKLNFEKIKDLNPDLIIGNKEENERSDMEELMKQYPVWMSDIKNLTDAYEMIRAVGTITNKNKEASSLAGKIKSEFNNFSSNTFQQKKEKLKTLYLIWKNPYMTINADTFINEMLAICGLVNVTEKLQGRYPEINEQEIKALNPQLILLSSEPFPFKEKHIKELQLLCPNAIIKLVDGEIFSWYGSRLLKAPEYFKKMMKNIG